MKTKKHFLRLSASILFFTFLLGCTKNDPPATPPEPSITVDCGENLSIAVGIPIKLTAKVTELSDYTVSWPSYSEQGIEITKLDESTAILKVNRSYSPFKLTVTATSGTKQTSTIVNVTVTASPAPDNLTATVQNSKSVKLDWNTVSGAETYAVYCSADNINFFKIARVSTNSYTDDGAIAGESYYKVGLELYDENSTPTLSKEIKVTGILLFTVEITDFAFAKYLNTKFPNSCNGGYLKYNSAEIRSHQATLDLQGLGIISLNGIQYFSAIQELWCNHNKLTSLDLSKNINIKRLQCHSNQLETLDLSSLPYNYTSDFGYNFYLSLNAGMGSTPPYINPITTLKVNSKFTSASAYKECKTKRGEAVKISTWKGSSSDLKAICSDFDPNTNTCTTP